MPYKTRDATFSDSDSNAVAYFDKTNSSKEQNSVVHFYKKNNLSEENNAVVNLDKNTTTEEKNAAADDAATHTIARLTNDNDETDDTFPTLSCQSSPSYDHDDYDNDDDEENNAADDDTTYTLGH